MYIWVQVPFMMKKLSVLIGLLFLLMRGQAGRAQQPALSSLTRHHGTNLRGLSIFQSKTIWVSGSNGQIGKSLDGGRTWRWYCPAGYGTRDFRDIQALDANTAVAMAIDTPAVILKTDDGGETWRPVYKNGAKGMFLDALDFSDAAHGIVAGDPVAGKIFLATTSDSGNHWTPAAYAAGAAIQEGEAFFAASGTNIHLNHNGSFLLVSGGIKSRYWSDTGATAIPTMMQGGLTKGANGMDVSGSRVAVAGGDFTDPRRSDSCIALSEDGGRTWRSSGKTPGGYISSIRFTSGDSLVICGLSGAWLSKDNGERWQPLTEQPFNTAFYDPVSRTTYFAGPDGAVSACFSY